MNSIDKEIYNLAIKTGEEHNLFLIDFIIRGTNRQRIIEIYYDGQDNVTAELLAEVSRELNSQIEASNLLEGSYRLDVSSPGIDRPLKFLQQYPKNLNRKFELSYSSGDETKKLAGKLIRIEGDMLTFLNGPTEVTVNFNNIKKAKVTVSFS